MPPPEASLANYRRQQALTVLTVESARRVWARLGTGDFDAAWSRLGPQLLLLLTAAQTAAARNGATSVGAALTELGIDAPATGTVSAEAFAGIASDGRDLASLLFEPVIATRAALGQGATLTQALATGRESLDRIVTTQVADAGRAAEGVAIASRPEVTGWVRMLNLPSCPRCVVLAGRFYRWNQGFERHPQCDCVHVPATEDVAGDIRTDPRKAIESGQVKGLSKADHRAIVEDGADPAQVINAHRGMSTEQVFGRRLKVTREGITRRAGKRLGPNGVRLRPESIYKVAKDREDAIRLLRRFGYIL